MTSYDFPPISKYFVLSRAYANFWAVRSNRRRVTRPDERCELERDTRDTFSRHKLSLRMQKSIAITMHVDLHSLFAIRQVGRIYDVHRWRPNVLCNRHCRGKDFGNSTSKIRQIDITSGNCVSNVSRASAFPFFDLSNYCANGNLISQIISGNFNRAPPLKIKKT